MPNIDPADWNYDTAAHLLLRAGFGHDGRYDKPTAEAKDVRTLADLTPDEAVDALLNFPLSKARGPSNLKEGFDANFPKLQRWWVLRMKKRPVLEKLVLFLHTHFATAYSKVDLSKYMAVQNALFREFALGDFRELVKRVTVNAAMLWWLDGKLNKVGVPNENYARELQELFTLGVFDFKGNKNYAQQDVVRAARILTGWTEDHTSKSITVSFDSDAHDTGSKVVYAVTTETPLQNAANKLTVPSNYSPADGEYTLLVDKIFDHIDTEGRPTVARFIARKMWKFYAYDPEVDFGTARADLTLIDELADEFKSGGYSLRSLFRAILLREEFYADNTRTVKGPTEYVVGSLRMLRGKISGDTKNNVGSDLLRQMGQELLNPPDVFSWRGNLAWITTQTLLERFGFGRDLSEGEKGRGFELGFTVAAYLDTSETTRQAVVDRFLKLLGPLTVDTATNTQLVNWLGPTDQSMDLTDTNYVRVTVRGLVNLILTLPQYLVH